MTRTARHRNRGGRPKGAGRQPRFNVSVSRATYRLVQGAAIARGMTMVAVVEEACRDVGVLSKSEGETSVESP